MSELYFIGIAQQTFRPSRAAKVVRIDASGRHHLLYDDGVKDFVEAGDMLGATGTREALSQVFDQAQIDEAFKNWEESKT